MRKKTRVAKELIENHQPAISVQVVNEVCVNLIRRTDFSEDELRALIVSFYGRYPVFELSRDVFVQASRLREQYALSFWDRLIVSSALQSGAGILYSEDMQDGLTVEDRLEIRNPFVVVR
jgi:predicted nucleic acid-binding protein